MIQIRAFKEKEKEGGEGKFQLGGQWKVQCLVAFGRRMKNIIFIFFHLPPNKFCLNIFFIDLNFLLCHGFRSLLYAFPSFSLTYKL
jgi:hypothetical protein